MCSAESCLKSVLWIVPVMSVAQAAAAVPPGEFPLEEPWEWAVAPHRVEWEGITGGDFTVFLCETPGTFPPEMRMVGGQVPVLVVGREEGVDYEIVVFDQDKAPVASPGGGSCGTANAAVHMICTKTPLSFVGVKKLTAQGADKLARKAADQLRGGGLILSVPQDGKPFSLDFERPGRPRIKVPPDPVAGHQGQVYILHCWASW